MINKLQFFALFIISFLLDVQAQQNAIIETSYFIDKTNTLTNFDIKSKQFKTSKNGLINLGFEKNTTWVKLKIDTTLVNSTEGILEVINPHHDEVTVFYDTKNSTKKTHTLGAKFPQKKNTLNNYTPTFKIPIEEITNPELYIKIKARWTTTAKFILTSRDSFEKNKVSVYFIFGIFYGGLLFIAIYNLFLFFTLKDIAYLLYFISTFFSCLSSGFLSGMFRQFLTPQLPAFTFSIFIYGMSLTSIFSCYFTLTFLNINRKYGFIYWILIFASLLPWVTIVTETTGMYVITRKIIIVQNLVIALIIYSSALYSLFVYKNRIALYFVVAWTMYLFGVVTYGLKSSGFAPINFFTNNSSYIGSFLEITLLSFALGYKYRLIRQQKEALEEQTREELEALVKIQTFELETSLEEKEVLLKEIHHRVKNNLQIIISLLDLQVASIKTVKDKNILLQSKIRVYSMSLIHQKLYQSNNLARIDLKSYLEELFTYITNSYTDSSLKIQYLFSVQNVELPITQSVPLGLIVNELLTNSLKYGVHPKNYKNIIELSLKTNTNSLELIVADSGQGFDNIQKPNLKESLGLFLVKSLTKQIKGEITNYYEKDLFKTQLTFPIIS